MSTNLVKYETDHGEVQLSPAVVKQYLVSGDPTKVTAQEVEMFLQLCRYQRLNPFLREAYLIKYGNQPATMVTGKDTFVKRAIKSELCTGFEAGIIVQTSDGKMEQRSGAFKLTSEKLLGGWAKVHRTDWKVPLEITVGLEEYEGRKSDGELNHSWKTKPATMIRKVALVQALRESMPEEFEGMYSPEEMNIDDSVLDGKVIDVTVEEPTVQMISKDQAKALFEAAGNDKATIDKALAFFGYKNSGEIPASEYESFLEAINEFKAAPVETDNAEQAKRDEVWAMLLEICMGDETGAQDKLEELTSFTASDGKEVKGKRTVDKLTSKQLPVTHREVKKIFDKFNAEMTLDGPSFEDAQAIFK